MMKALGWLIAAFALTFATLQGAVAAPALVMPPVIQLVPLPATATPQQMSFARGAFQIGEGKTWAYEGDGLACLVGGGPLFARPLSWKASDFELDNARMGSVFREEAAQAGFLRGGTVNLFETGPAGDRYQVAALITAMDGRICAFYDARPTPYMGRMRMSVEWQVFDTLSRQVVRRISTDAGGEERRSSTDGIERIFFAAFRANVRALLASEDFRGLVTSTPSTTPASAALSPLPFLSAPVAKRPISSAAEAVAAVFTGDGLGSGFLISTEGYLLTNHHVVGRAKYVKVRWSDGAETVGEVIRSDPRRDVAIIKADPGRRTPLAIRTTAAGLGEAVFAIGTPLEAKFQGSVTKGVVSATRTYEGLAYIQSDVSINGGNSGGPLIDESGGVLGMAVAGYEISGAPVGINLFIPIDDALKALALTPAP